MRILWVVVGIFASVLAVAEDGQPARVSGASTGVSTAFEKPETAVLDAFARAMADAFLKSDEAAFQELIVPAEVLPKVFTTESLKGAPTDLQRLLVEGNLKRFREFRGHFQDLREFEFKSVESGNPQANASGYFEPQRVLHNTYITVAKTHRLILKFRLEDIVLLDGKCYLLKLD